MDEIVYADYSMLRDEEGLDSMCFGIEAYVYDDDTDEQRKVGHARGYLYRINDDEEGWRSAWYAADAVSGDLEYILSTVRKAFEDEYCDKLFILDSLSISEEQRNKGIGRGFMERIIEDLSFLDTDVIVLTPGYYRKNISLEQKLNNARLLKFYKRLGFSVTKNDSENGMVMERWLA